MKALSANLGYPRIGEKRELKFALEKYWAGTTSAIELENTAKEIRLHNWKIQSKLNFISLFTIISSTSLATSTYSRKSTKIYPFQNLMNTFPRQGATKKMGKMSLPWK